MTREISPERRTAFYLGTGLLICGFGLFLFNICTLLIFHSIFLFVALVGIGFVAIASGAILRTYGQRGAAGAGLVLNPQQAREDLEPYSRMAGGMVKDALEESGLKGSALSVQKADEVIRIRCRSCSALNEEDAKFCKECGNPL